MVEQWIDVVGFEGHYQVSTTGNVRSIKKGQMKLRAQQRQNSGYLQVSLSVSNKVKNCTVHRLVAIAFIPNPYNLPQVNHIDGIKTNNNLSNLEWITASENGKHSFANGRRESARGKARERMRLLGFKYGRANLEKTREILSRKLILIGPDGEIPMPSLRKAGEFLRADHGSVSRHINTGKEFRGYKIKSV